MWGRPISGCMREAGAGRGSCAHWRRRIAAAGLTTPAWLPGRLVVMNNNARPSRSILDDARPGTRPDPKPRPIASATADGTSADDDAAWLRRLALAVTAGLIVAAPRTALLVTELLRPPVSRSTSTPTGQAAEPRTTGDRRIAS
jgi:hypothetical protein